MSELPKPTPSNQPSPETTGQPSVDSPTAPTPKKGWTIDQSLLATVALSIISLCALIVSIYQTRVLSQQQEVMAEQQRIMTESAKAQLWPNVEIGRNRGYEDGVTLSMLDFTIANTGTGPAIIEGATVQYEGKYAKNWDGLFRLMNLPDTISTLKNDAPISSGVLPTGDFRTVLGLSINQPLMEYIGRVVDNESFTITICYRSVFNDYWLREHKDGPRGFDRLTPVDSCVIADSIAFTN
ncbi:MAG: hypothetical protein WA958_12510 [Tunicatimonas sp.]